MIELKGFLTKDSFSELIEGKVLSGMTYFEAVIDFADECDRSPEELLPFMSQVLIDKLRRCAKDNGLINTNEATLEDLM